MEPRGELRPDRRRAMEVGGKIFNDILRATENTLRVLSSKVT